jgi:DNA gyrase subunit A
VIQNLINLPSDDKVKAYIKIDNLEDEEFINNNYLMFCTKKGIVKKTIVEAFSRPRVNGINAITINEGDMLLEVKLTNGSSEVVLANKNGRAVRFNESEVRSMGRGAAGVRGMKIDDHSGDEIVGMITLDPTDPENTIFVISEKGNGKRSALEEYRTTKRGAKGVKTMKITDKTGKLVSIKLISDNEDIMITTLSGIVIRLGSENLRVMGRATQGVRVIKLDKGESIGDITVIAKAEEDNFEEE